MFFQVIKPLFSRGLQFLEGFEKMLVKNSTAVFVLCPNPSCSECLSAKYMANISSPTLLAENYVMYLMGC